MTAGLPGVGIGGIFYLASALLMPFHSLAAVLRGRPDEARWPLALRQAALAALILGALWLTGLALGWIIPLVFPEATRLVAGEGAVPGQVHNVVRAGAFLLSFGTLGVVLLAVQLLRVVLPAKATRPDHSSASRTSPRSAA
ncbi:MAG: hypothetical protein ABIY52_15095 [Gemmatimonadaceae bacterium]